MSIHVAGHTIQLEAAGAGSTLEPLFSDVWLGTELWPAARALVHFMEQQRREALTSAELVLELGSGTGACGLAAAALGAQQVVLTDKAELVPALLANIEANGWHAGGERVVRCQELTWARTLSGLPTGSDLVLCSDCLNPVYGTEHAAALAATIHALLSRAQAQHGAQCLEALVSQTRRGDEVAERAFFAACDEIGLASTVLLRVHVTAAGAVVPLTEANGIDGGDAASTAEGQSGVAQTAQHHVVAIHSVTLAKSSVAK